MKITIVGGGTIGWLTAFILSKKSPFHVYTVVESSKHPIIGVGESLTGLMTDVFLDPEFQLNELEFLKKTWSLPKYGIQGFKTVAIPSSYKRLPTEDHVAFFVFASALYRTPKPLSFKVILTLLPDPTTSGSTNVKDLGLIFLP